MKRLRTTILATLAVLLLAAAGWGQSTYVVMQNAAAGNVNGTALNMRTSGQADAASIRVVGTGTFTVNFEATIETDGTGFTAVSSTNVATGAQATTVTADGWFTVVAPKAAQLRARISGCAACSVTVKGLPTAGSVVARGPGFMSGSATSGQVTYWSGTTSLAGSAAFVWDNSNSRLGIGRATPSNILHVDSEGLTPVSVGTTPGTNAPAMFGIGNSANGGDTTIITTGTGGVGSTINLNTGKGGQATAAATAATGGNGGAFTLNMGAGAASTVAGTGTNNGGTGGAANVTGGTGGAATSSSSGTNTGGTGGALNFTAGTGGAANTGSGTNTGGTGGGFNFNAGRGGIGTTTGGNGGAAALQGGIAAAAAGSAGGAASIIGKDGSSTGSGGAGGNAGVTAGNAGGDGTVSRAGGTIILTAGNAVGGGAAGVVTITGGTGSAVGSASNGALVTLQGGPAGAIAASVGGAVAITGRAGSATSTGAAGGAVTIISGAAGGTGSNAGGVLSLTAGASSGTDTAGATTTIKGAPGTSQGVPGRTHLQGGALIAASGTTVQTLIDRDIIGASKVLTHDSVTTVANVTVASDTAAGVIVDYAVEVSDGASHHLNVEHGSVVCNVVNSNATITVGGTNGCTKYGNQNLATTIGGDGTLTVTWTLTAANPALLRINAATTVITPATGYPRLVYSLRNLTQQAIAIQ